MSRKRKYYVVWKGRKSGVLRSWEACRESVHGVKGARYKAFATLKLAERAFSEGYQYHVGQKSAAKGVSPSGVPPGKGHPSGLNGLSVDAACSGNPGPMEYRGVDTKTGKEVFREGPFEEATNNVGEFLALVHGLALLKAGKDMRPVYSDSRTAISWVRKKNTRTALKKTAKNKPLFELIERALEWLKENEFNNPVIKWDTEAWGEIPADFGRK